MTLLPRLLLLALLALALAPLRGLAAEVALLGTWEIAEAAPAPWTTEKDRPALAAEGRRLVNVEIAFRPREVAAKGKALACKNPRYEATDYSPDALFRGALPEPQQDRMAKELGLPRGDVPGVDVTCAAGAFSYHFRDKDTALMALDDVIYTLRRRM
jgi:hypothetical protein